MTFLPQNHRFFLRIVPNEVIFGRSIGWGAPLEDWVGEIFSADCDYFGLKSQSSRGYKPCDTFLRMPETFVARRELESTTNGQKGLGRRPGQRVGLKKVFFWFSQGWLPICSGEAWCISFCCWVIWSDLKKRHSLDWCQDISAPEQSGSTCDIGGSTPIFLECRRGWSST